MKVSIVGDGVITAGDYEKVTVVGDAKVTDDFKTNKLAVVGDIDSEGNIDAKKAKVVGDLCANEVNSDEFKLVGDMDSDVLTCIKATIIGNVNVGNINASTFNTKSCELKVEEINADSIDLRNTSGTVRSIVGERIKIYKKRDNIFISGNMDILSVDEIEGDYVYLERVNAKKVSGDYVEIGPNCNIDYLDSKNKKIHKSSTVKVGGCIE